MKNYKKIFISAFLVFAIQAVSIYAAPEKLPKWVDDYNSVYPDSDWVAVVESASSKQAADSKAAGALASRFKVDVAATTQAAESLSRAVSGGKSSYAQNSSVSKQTDTSSNVSGLMGVTVDSFVSKDGTAYACARMNRKEAGTAYSNIIKENNNVITGLQKDAAANKGTFEAYECLAVATDIAVLTDNQLEILSVLNPAMRDSIKVSYGNANTLKKAALDNTKSIVISVQVETNADDSGRIKKALQKVFTTRGFRTTDKPDSKSYILETMLRITDAPIQNQNKFVRYEITSAISDSSGTELFTFSATGREGHLNYTEAIERALRRVESSIGDADDEESFTSVFNEYLVSLLK
ncbi:MAG: hypothetical protein Ta2F_06860 [Termitinemataceae bacterium]|nr:MAG: hypothetical protein Ta2F_06860 [Termitinemataceae bacterium]